MRNWKARLLTLLAAVAMLLAVSAPAVMADDFDPDFAVLDGNDVLVCGEEEEDDGFGDNSLFGNRFGDDSLFDDGFGINDGFGDNNVLGDGFGINDGFGDDDEEEFECKNVDLVNEFDEFARVID